MSVLKRFYTFIPHIILTALFAAPVFSYCGAQDYKYLFISKVTAADSTGAPIQGCHIINKTQRIGTVSDEFGAFRITAEVNDSITFSALGYEKLTIAVADSMYHNDRIIRLNPVAYELEEVNIKPFRLDLPPVSKYEIYTQPLPNQGGINIPVQFSPITFLYDRFSKEAKQRRHYQKVMDGS